MMKVIGSINSDIKCSHGKEDSLGIFHVQCVNGTKLFLFQLSVRSMVFLFASDLSPLQGHLMRFRDEA